MVWIVLLMLCRTGSVLSFECEQRVAQAVVVSDDDGGKESQGG